MVFKKGCETWNKGLSGKDYLKHYKDEKTWIMASHKKNISPMLGKKQSEYQKKIVSEIMKNRDNTYLIDNKFRLGIPHSEEDRKKISIGVKKYYKKHPDRFKKNEEQRKKISETRKEFFKNNPESRKKCFLISKKERIKNTKKQWEGNHKKMVDSLKTSWTTERRKKQSIKFLTENPIFRPDIRKKICIKPSKPEKILIELFKKYKIPFNYVGDWNFWLGIRKKKNPDFIHLNKNKIIEYNGYYTHNEQEEKNRREFFRRYGYKVLFLHSKNLKNEVKLINKINIFMGGEIGKEH
jgi:hypothetical protein